MGGCLFKVDTFSHTFALSLFSINKMKKKKHWSSFIPDIYDVFLVGEQDIFGHQGGVYSGRCLFRGVLIQSGQVKLL